MHNKIAKNVSYYNSFIIIIGGLINYLTMLSLQIFIINFIYGQNYNVNPQILKPKVNLSIKGTNSDDKITIGNGDATLVG